jgi:hypothetical protein
MSCPILEIKIQFTVYISWKIYMEKNLSFKTTPQSIPSKAAKLTGFLVPFLHNRFWGKLKQTAGRKYIFQMNC